MHGMSVLPRFQRALRGFPGLYSPLEPLFTKTWRPREVESVG
jgi:hypothetical protein